MKWAIQCWVGSVVCVLLEMEESTSLCGKGEKNFSVVLESRTVYSEAFELFCLFLLFVVIF